MKNLYRFFDNFGILVFLFLIIDSIFYLKAGITDWRVYTRLFIGIIGFLVDSYLVYFYKKR